MRWQRGTSNADIEDRRGAGGGFGRGPRGGGLRLGLGGLILIGILSLVFKQNFFALLDQVPTDTSGGLSGSASTPAATSPEDDERFEFVKFVLNDTQDTWARVLPEQGQRYDRAKLVVFRDAVQSACGFAEAASGPFYCPGDQKVYIDLGFYDDLRARFGAAGDFAQAYVIAHEIGHHLQNLLGIEERVRRAQESRPDRANDLSVRMELQADCLAGVWANLAQKRHNWLEAGDIESALNAANAIGDDRLQQQSQGRVMPDSFTHGTSAQRVKWFKTGFAQGNINQCDTFSAARL